MQSPNLSNNRVLIAIPAYNEEDTIGGVVESIQNLLPDFDLLVINDGSSDATGPKKKLRISLSIPTTVNLCWQKNCAASEPINPAEPVIKITDTNYKSFLIK